MSHQHFPRGQLPLPQEGFGTQHPEKNKCRFILCLGLVQELQGKRTTKGL